MTTQKFIESLETIIDEWSGDEIEPDRLLKAIEEIIPKTCVESFIKDYGYCCLECALNKYFEKSEEYKKVDELPK